MEIHLLMGDEDTNLQCWLQCLCLQLFKKPHFKNKSKLTCTGQYQQGLSHPAGIYMFKVDNRNTRTRCEICSKFYFYR